jgi:hypothetical protein
MNRIRWIVAILGLVANVYFASLFKDCWGKDPGMGGMATAFLLLLSIAGSGLCLIAGGSMAIRKTQSLTPFLKHLATIISAINLMLNGVFVYGYFLLAPPQ